jgi:hypothetical protein
MLDVFGLIPTCTAVTLLDDTVYAVPRVYNALSDKENAVKVEAVYQSAEGVVYVLLDKAVQEKPGQPQPPPVRILAIPLGQYKEVGLAVDKKVAEICALMQRRHLALWITRWNELYAPPPGEDEEGDDGEFEITDEDLDEIPIEELKKALERRK